MRIWTKGLVAALAALFVASSAQAVATFDIEFNSLTSGTLISGVPGDTAITCGVGGCNYIVDVFVTLGTEGMSSVFYDLLGTSGSGLIGADNGITAPNGSAYCNTGLFGPACNMSGLGAPSASGSDITGFSMTTTGVGPTGGTWLIGFALFSVTGNSTNSISIASAFDNALPGNPLTTVVNGFSVTVVPEPATAGLLALGLAGLAFAGRRRRS